MKLKSWPVRCGLSRQAQAAIDERIEYIFNREQPVYDHPEYPGNEAAEEENLPEKNKPEKVIGVLKNAFASIGKSEIEMEGNKEPDE